MDSYRGHAEGFVRTLKSGETVFVYSDHSTGEQEVLTSNNAPNLIYAGNQTNSGHTRTASQCLSHKEHIRRTMENTGTQTGRDAIRESAVEMATTSVCNDVGGSTFNKKYTSTGTETDLNAVGDRKTLESLLRWALSICSSENNYSSPDQVAQEVQLCNRCEKSIISPVESPQEELNINRYMEMPCAENDDVVSRNDDEDEFIPDKNPSQSSGTTSANVHKALVFTGETKYNSNLAEDSDIEAESKSILDATMSREQAMEVDCENGREIYARINLPYSFEETPQGNVNVADERLAPPDTIQCGDSGRRNVNTCTREGSGVVYQNIVFEDGSLVRPESIEYGDSRRGNVNTSIREGDGGVDFKNNKEDESLDGPESIQCGDSGRRNVDTSVREDNGMLFQNNVREDGNFVPPESITYVNSGRENLNAAIRDGSGVASRNTMKTLQHFHDGTGNVNSSIHDDSDQTIPVQRGSGALTLAENRQQLRFSEIVSRNTVKTLQHLHDGTGNANSSSPEDSDHNIAVYSDGEALSLGESHQPKFSEIVSRNTVKTLQHLHNVTVNANNSNHDDSDQAIPVQRSSGAVSQVESHLIQSSEIKSRNTLDIYDDDVRGNANSISCESSVQTLAQSSQMVPRSIVEAEMINPSEMTDKDSGLRRLWDSSIRTFIRQDIVMEDNTPQGKPRHKCTTCGKELMSNRSLMNHIKMIHRMEKPYLCTICDRWYATQGTLTNHTRIHTQEKLFSCTICGKRFTDGANHRRHLRVHTKEKPYTCNFCGKQFARSDSLGVHQQACHIK